MWYFLSCEWSQPRGTMKGSFEIKHNSSTGRNTKYLRKNNVWDLKNDEILDSFSAKMIKSESALKNWATNFNIWKKWWTGLSRILLTNISHDAFGTDSRSLEREQGYSGGSELFFVMGFVRRTCKLSVFALIRLFPLWEQPQNVITWAD